jgi:hypothetical protein
MTDIDAAGAPMRRDGAHRDHLEIFREFLEHLGRAAGGPEPRQRNTENGRRSSLSSQARS